jgi:hypothetical protein
MNIRTGLALLNKPWLIEQSAAIQLLSYWETAKANGGEWDYNKAIDRQQPINNKFLQSSVIVSPVSNWEMQDFKGFDGAETAVIPVTGALMKADSCGGFGTSSLMGMFNQASNTPSIRNIFLAFDTPGGTVDGTETFANAIKMSTKRTIAMVDGMVCSAGYWLASACNEIYATSSTDMIGCIGTMVSMYDDTKRMAEKGVVIREYYATESTDKNSEFNQALKGDGTKLISELLDPINDSFLNSVKEGRGDKLNMDMNPLTGKTYTAAAAQEAGLIDGIKSFNTILTESNRQSIFFNNSKKNSRMTAEQIKTAYPEAYAEILTAGATGAVKAEQDRVNTWLVYQDVDATAVKEGITSGATMTGAQHAEYARKAYGLEALKTQESANPPALPTVQPVSGAAATKVDEDAEMKNWVKEQVAACRPSTLNFKN